jgi:AcrR family transcriptional regulator
LVVMSRRVAPTRPAHGNQARAERTRALAIDVTVQIVLREGFAAATGRHIADGAGVTWGVIQYHFGDRGGLLMAVVDRGFGELLYALESLPPATPRTTTRERVDTVVTAAWNAMSSPGGGGPQKSLCGKRDTLGDQAAGHLRQLAKTFATLGSTIAIDLDPTQSAAIGEHMLTTLRGMIATQLIMPKAVDTTNDRRVLVDLLSGYIQTTKCEQ